MLLSFVIHCSPVAQPRQRHRIVTTGKTQFVANYTPRRSPVTEFKQMAKYAASQAYSGPPLRCPVILTAAFVFPRPGRLVWKKREMPRCPHTTKPDADNLAKSLQDALTGVLWHDDAVLWYVLITKVYAAGDEQPHVDVNVEWDDEQV